MYWQGQRGIDSAYAPFTCKVLAIFKWKETIFPNTVLIGSCDYDGNPAKVMCDDKVARVVTLQFTHDNDISDLAVGMVIRSGERFYEEGTTGNATGNHIHIEAAEGWQYKQVKINGVYQLPNRIHVYQVFNVLKGWAVSKSIGTRSSKKGLQGIIKKFMYAVIIFVAMLIDYLIMLVGGTFGISFPINLFFGTLITIWFVINEMISIIENAIKLDVQLPSFLQKFLDLMKTTIEQKGNEEIEKIDINKTQ